MKMIGKIKTIYDYAVVVNFYKILREDKDLISKLGIKNFSFSKEPINVLGSLEIVELTDCNGKCELEL